MAYSVLITCPNCGHMVYGRAWRCPECGGSDNKQKSGKSRQSGWISGITLLAALGTRIRNILTWV